MVVDGDGTRTWMNRGYDLVRGRGWAGRILLVMRRSGVRFPKDAQFKVLISSVCSHGSPACLGHEGDVPRLIVGDMRSRRVSQGGSLLVNGRWDRECSNPIPVLRGRRGCSWLPGLVPECRRRPVVVTHHAGLYSGACIASPSAPQVHERPPGGLCDASTLGHPPAGVVPARLWRPRSRPST